MASIYDIYSPEELETMGFLSQAVANQPKFFDVTQEVSKMGDMVPIAAGSANPEALTKTGFGGNKVFVGVGDKASDVASMYAKEGILRGTPLGTSTSEPFKGLVPKGDIEFGRNMFGHLEGKVSPDVANRAFNLPSSGIATAVPQSFYTRLGRLAPGANVVLGATSAANRFAQGQPLRGIAAIGSMIPGPLGYLGLGAETAMDFGASYFDRMMDRLRAESEERRKKDPVVEPKVNPLSRRVTRSVLPTEPQSRSQDTNRGGGPGVTIGAGGGQTRTVDPRSRAAMYSTPTRRSAPPPFRRFNNGGIVSLLGGF